MENGKPKSPVMQALEKAETLGHKCLLVMFDPQTEGVSVSWDGFKNFSYAAAVLDMGKQAVNDAAKAAQMQAMMQNAQAQAQADALGLLPGGAIKLGRH